MSLIKRYTWIFPLFQAAFCCVRSNPSPPPIPPVSQEIDPYLQSQIPFKGFNPNSFSQVPIGSQGSGGVAPPPDFVDNQQIPAEYDPYDNYENSADYGGSLPFSNKKKSLTPNSIPGLEQKKPDRPPIVLHFRPDPNRTGQKNASEPNVVSKTFQRIKYSGLPSHLIRFFSKNHRNTQRPGSQKGKIPELKIFDAAKKKSHQVPNRMRSSHRAKSEHVFQAVPSDRILNQSSAAAPRLLDPVKKFLGSRVHTERWNNLRYNEANGGPITDEIQLDCRFETPCCYTNAEAPEDEIDWQLASGQPDLRSMRVNFGTENFPSGKYLVAALPPGGQNLEAEARFVSCSIYCTSGKAQIFLNHWSTDSVVVEVCTTDGFITDPKSVPLRNCKTLEKWTSPGPEVVTLPAGKHFNVVIVATNFSYTGGMAVIDNILVDYTVCTEDANQKLVSPADIPESGAQSLPQSDHECLTVACDFENNDACSYANMYEPQIKSNPTTKVFNIQAGRFRNSVTGIKQSGQGMYYLASYLFPGEVAGIETATILLQPRNIVFYYYAATQQIEFFGCCDSVSYCPFQSSQIVDYTDRLWRQATFTCPKGTSRVIFLCTNDGGNQGACGLDNIQIYSVENSTNLCH